MCFYKYKKHGSFSDHLMLITSVELKMALVLFP